MAFRRVAAHRVAVGDKELRQCVVEIQDGIVVNYYVFSDELPLTEWLGGLIEIKPDDDGFLTAYWNGKQLE